jgi:hypothetical protein
MGPYGQSPDSSAQADKVSRTFPIPKLISRLVRSDELWKLTQKLGRRV